MMGLEKSMRLLNLGTRADGQPFTLPEQFVRSRYAIVAASGYGKTVGWMKMAEQLLKLNRLFMALDVVGNGWGLRVGKDGNPGLPVLVVGGRRGDMPLDPSQGKRYAHALTSALMSVVIDLSTTALDDRWRFTSDFCSELLMIQSEHEWHVFFEELKELASQNPRNKWHKRSTDAVDSFCTLCQNYGYGYTVVGQRTAIMAKGPLTQAQALFAMHLQGTLDIDSILEWIQNNGPDLESLGGKKGLSKILPTLDPGEALFVDPSSPEPLVRMRFGERETIHPAEVRKANPKLLRNVQMTDVQSFAQGLAASIHAETSKTVAAVPGPAPAARREPTAHRAPVAHAPEKVHRAPADDRLQAENAALKAKVTELETKVAEHEAKLATAEAEAQEMGRILDMVRNLSRPQWEVLQKLYGVLETAPAPSAPGTPSGGRFDRWLSQAPKEGMRKMLELLIEQGTATRQQLITVARIGNTTFYEYIGWLKRNGLAVKDKKGFRLGQV